MKLKELEYAPVHRLAAPSIINRVQRGRAGRGSVTIGPLHLPPSGLMGGRFDLRDVEVGYFSESGVTAIYEALARRDAALLSLANAKTRVLLKVRTTEELTLLDLRPHAGTWPVLQSTRYSETQELAKDVRDAGYDGLVYRSAQHPGADSYALFAATLKTLRREDRRDLVHRTTGAFHNELYEAVRRSRIPVG